MPVGHLTGLSGAAVANISGSVGSLLNFYKHERNIFGRCPECGIPFRLSEVKLTYGKEPPRDVVTRLKRDRDKLKAQLDELETEIADIEADHADELGTIREAHAGELDSLDQQWRDKVDIAVQKHLLDKIRDIRRDAIARSRVGQLGKTIEKVVPMFPGFGFHPSDVRPIFDPIDFVIFDGCFNGGVTDVVFVEFKTGQSRLTPLQASIKEAVNNKRVHFKERRMSKEAIKLLTEGRRPKLQHLVT